MGEALCERFVSMSVRPPKFGAPNGEKVARPPTCFQRVSCFAEGWGRLDPQQTSHVWLGKPPDIRISFEAPDTGLRTRQTPFCESSKLSDAWRLRPKACASDEQKNVPSCPRSSKQPQLAPHMLQPLEYPTRPPREQAPSLKNQMFGHEAAKLARSRQGGNEPKTEKQLPPPRCKTRTT